jgi:hypothetical protein
MKIGKVISRLASDSSDPDELRRVARALGNELPRNRVERLREFRSQLACVAIGSQAEANIDEVSYATGYVAGLSDVSTEYEVAVNGVEDKVTLSADMARGIRLAVEFFQYAQGSHHASGTMQAVATRVLHDPDAAAAAVALWQNESHRAGINHAAAGSRADEGGPSIVSVPEALLWEAEKARVQASESAPPRPSLLRAITESPFDDDSEPSRSIPITG